MSLMFNREARLVGAVLAYATGFEDATRSGLMPQHFEDCQLGRIWQACLDVSADGDPVDLVSVGERLARDGDLERVGNCTGLTELFGAAATGATVRHDAMKVREAGNVRMTARDGRAILDNAVTGMATADEVRGWAEGVADDLRPVQHASFRTAASVMADEEDGAGHPLTPSGIPDLDEIVTGFGPGDFVLVAARPSIGKTSLMLDVARIWSARGEVVAVSSLEMTRRKVMNRLLSQASGVPLSEIRDRAFKAPEGAESFRIAATAFKSAALVVDDTRNVRVCDLEGAVKRLNPRPSLLVVDYLGLIRAVRKGPLNEMVTEISRDLKSMAGDLGIVLVVGSQLNRASEKDNRPPVLSDLRDSGSLEQDADIVVMLHQPGSEPSERMVYVRKNRDGRTGECPLRFHPEVTSFHPGSVSVREPF